MKKSVLAICAVGIIASATVLTQNRKTEIRKPRCVGYTVIEVDKAINCKGDTIRLQKQNGFYQLASNE